MTTQDLHRPAGRLWIPRRRGALRGLLLVLLGVWGALIPFVGPYFGFAYPPDTVWTWTSARWWFEVLPGACTAVGGLLLLVSGNRATAAAGSWLACAAGAWFVLGPVFAPLLSAGSIGTATASDSTMRVLENIAFFSGLGVVVLFLGATALGRVTVRSVADLRLAEARSPQPVSGVPAAGSTEPPAIRSTDTGARRGLLHWRPAH